MSVLTFLRPSRVARILTEEEKEDVTTENTAFGRKTRLREFFREQHNCMQRRILHWLLLLPPYSFRRRLTDVD